MQSSVLAQTLEGPVLHNASNLIPRLPLPNEKGDRGEGAWE